MENSKYPRIYFGPMSKNIVDTLLELSTEYPIGFIPSRRQVEYDGGYVNGWTSKDFYSYVKQSNNSVLVCRDHGGRLQGSKPDDGVQSLSHDSQIGFDIIHIDPWKQFETIEEVATETASMIKHCLSLNPDLKFEVGTEEAIHRYDSEGLFNFLFLLRRSLKDDFSSIKYAVVQFGTAIRGTRNVGVFDKERSARMISVCRAFNVMSKEHNGDYLSFNEIQQRFNLGLDAINIAPEYGVFETSRLIDYLTSNIELDKLEQFYDLCESSNKWVKWMPRINKYKSLRRRPFYDFLLCKVCGHYLFNNPEVLKWKSDDASIDIFLKKSLKTKLNSLLQTTYRREE